MAGLVFFYVPGNLDNSINYFAEINDIYRLEDSDSAFEKSIRSYRRSKPNCMALGARNSLGLYVNLVPGKTGNRSLLFLGPLKNLDGTVYESLITRRNNETVREAGKKLIKKHGEFHVKALEDRFNEEFGAVFEEDYGIYEVLMFEFFLKNLPLLNALDLRVFSDKIIN